MLDHQMPSIERRCDEDHHCGRRDHCPMMEDSAIDEIAEKAASKAIEKLTAHVYQEIGKSLVSKFFYVMGAVGVGVYIWLKTNGYIK